MRRIWTQEKEKANQNYSWETHYLCEECYYMAFEDPGEEPEFEMVDSGEFACEVCCFKLPFQL